MSDAGPGYLLRQLAVHCPQATELAGVDPAPAMVEAARTAATDGRLRWLEGAAEEQPRPQGPHQTAYDPAADSGRIPGHSVA
jgi:hypothetical protein